MKYLALPREINGLATAIMIIKQIQSGLITPAETPEMLDKALKALQEQREYIIGDNPEKIFGHPKTYNLPEKEEKE